jgi:hypothetical protein
MSDNYHMPSVEAIDRIKNVVNSLGNEQAILQERGTAIEDVLPPSSMPDDDLQDLLGSDSAQETPSSMDSLLSSLDEEPDEEDFSLDMPDDTMPPALDSELGDLAGLDDLEDLTADDLSDDLAGLDDLEDMTVDDPGDDLSGLDDLEDLTADDLNDDLAGLDDLEDLTADDPGDDLSGLDDLEDLTADELGDDLNMDDLGDDIPDTDTALNNLSESLEEGEDSPEGEEILLDEDFGLNEIEEDFLDDLEDEGVGQFSLDDFGGDYNFTEEDSSSDLGLDLDELENDINKASDAEAGSSFSMTEDDLEYLEAGLHNLPLNLKMAVQNFLAREETTVDQINKMNDLIKSGSPVKSIASLYKKYTGRKIDIPRGYEKRSAEDFQKEKNSLANYTREKVLPRIGLGLGLFAIFWLLTVILFNFVYRPLKSESLYREGEALIAQDLYDEGEALFDDAFFGWKIGSFNVQGVPNKDKFYSYARTYEGRRKYNRAETKYQQLLQAYPSESKGRIAYGNLLSEKMVRYKDAEYILKGADPLMLAEASAGLASYSEIPLKEITEINNIDQLILLGDNYLAWASEDPDQYENARYIYATLLRDKPGGSNDRVLLRMLRYFIRTHNKEQINILEATYKDKESVKAPVRLQAEVFSELAGWLIDNDRVMESREFILKAERADRTVPDLHYQYARFFSATYNSEGEKDALTNALGFLNQQDVLSKDHLFMKIDAYRRLGNLAFKVANYPKANEQYNLALETYENSRRLNLISSSPEIGALYGEMGNLNYNWYKDYDRALEYYNLAEENFGGTPDIKYKKGFIYYTEKMNYKEALIEFYEVSRYYPENKNLLLSMGNTLLKREDYYGAISMYEQLLTQLKIQEENIKVLLPDEKEEEWALIEYLIMTYNNLGVAQDGVARKTPNRAMRNRSLASFTSSSEYFDKLLRDRDTLIKTTEPDQAAQNRQNLIEDTGEKADLQIYPRIMPLLDDIPLYYRSPRE